MWLTERHAVGGPGTFLLGKAEELSETLLREYRGKVRLIYLDPPFRTGESFSMKIGKGKQAQTVVLDPAELEWRRQKFRVLDDRD